MRCVCCRSPVDEEKVCCPRCGFPLLGGDQENRRRIAGDYRKKLLGDTFLSVRQYFYGYDSDGDLQELKSEYVRAACAGELPPEGIRWLDTEFAPLASGRDVELRRDGMWSWKYRSKTAAVRAAPSCSSRQASSTG